MLHNNRYRFTVSFIIFSIIFIFYNKAIGWSKPKIGSMNTLNSKSGVILPLSQNMRYNIRMVQYNLNPTFVVEIVHGYLIEFCTAPLLSIIEYNHKFFKIFENFPKIVGL